MGIMSVSHPNASSPPHPPPWAHPPFGLWIHAQPGPFSISASPAQAGYPSPPYLIRRNQSHAENYQEDVISRDGGFRNLFKIPSSSSPIHTIVYSYTPCSSLLVSVIVQKAEPNGKAIQELIGFQKVFFLQNDLTKRRSLPEPLSYKLLQPPHVHPFTSTGILTHTRKVHATSYSLIVNNKCYIVVHHNVSLHGNVV